MAGNRKNELKALFGGGLGPTANRPAPERKSADGGNAAEGDARDETAAAPPARSASGAVKAMGLSLNAITRDADEARALRQALSEGERIVSIDPAQIEASFVEDRLPTEGKTDADFERLVESLRDAGQQVPVLLRPHPEKDGVYQTAYGHRRIRAAARLGRPVKAVVRALSDDELVLAQGKENAERRNLSFIERGLFAHNLASRGFDRKTICDALAVQKSELSRLIQVAEGVPERFIRMIGPAPRAGRERWMKLGELLKSEAKHMIAIDILYSDKFKALDSDQRFQTLFSRLSWTSKEKATKPDAERVLTDDRGRVFGHLRVEGGIARIEFARGTPTAFIDAAAGLLARAHEEFSHEGDADG